MTGLPIEFLYSAVKIKANFAGPDGSSHDRQGTGFFVSRSGTFFLVTNRHVVDASWDAPNKNANSTRYRGFTLQPIFCSARVSGTGLRDFIVVGRVIFSEKYNDDVAVVKISTVLSPTTGWEIPE